MTVALRSLDLKKLPAIAVQRDESCLMTFDQVNDPAREWAAKCCAPPSRSPPSALKSTDQQGSWADVLDAAAARPA